MKRAIILAGGKGTRLKPYTTLIPKPLVPLGGKYSILEIVILQLKNSGFDHITLAVNHLSHLIMSYFGDGNRLGIYIDYSLEEVPLNTIGPLTLIEDLPENFLVMNGDILCDLDYGSFYLNHCETRSLISVSSYCRTSRVDFGVLGLDSKNRLISFTEKPVHHYQVSMGVYCLNRSVIEALPKGHSYGFDQLMLDAIKNSVNVQVDLFTGYWLDIGRPEDYEYADQNFDELILKLNLPSP